MLLINHYACHVPKFVKTVGQFCKRLFAETQNGAVYMCKRDSPNEDISKVANPLPFVVFSSVILVCEVHVGHLMLPIYLLFP